MFLRDGAVEGGCLPRRGHLDVKSGFIALVRDERHLEVAPEWLCTVDGGVGDTLFLDSNFLFSIAGWPVDDDAVWSYSDTRAEPAAAASSTLP